MYFFIELFQKKDLCCWFCRSYIQILWNQYQGFKWIWGLVFNLTPIIEYFKSLFLTIWCWYPLVSGTFYVYYSLLTCNQKAVIFCWYIL